MLFANESIKNEWFRRVKIAISCGLGTYSSCWSGARAAEAGNTSESGFKNSRNNNNDDDDRNLLTESMNVSAQPEKKNSIKTCLAANREGELYDFGTKSGFRWRQRQLRLRLFGMEQSKGPEFRP